MSAVPAATPRHWDVARAYGLVQDAPDWQRCALRQVALDPVSGGVGLTRRPETAGDPGAMDRTVLGVAVDRQCRLYLGDRDTGTVRTVARPTEPGAAHRLRHFLGTPAPRMLGDFRTRPVSTGGLDVLALAVDSQDRLIVLDGHTDTVLIVDLWQRRVLQRIRVGAPSGPWGTTVDVAVSDRAAWVLLDGPPAIARLDGRVLRSPDALDPALRPVRLAASPGGVLALLSHDPDGTDRVHVLDGSPAVAVPGATDLAFETDERLVVGRGPEADLIELRRLAGGFVPGGARRGHRFPGFGLTRIDAGRVGYWDGTRLRRAVPAPERFGTGGYLTTFRFDSGRYGNTWGRLFLDACIPRDTAVRVTAFASDERDADAVPALTALAPGAHPVLRRREGRELAWDRLPADDLFETYEAPVLARPGRYLWLRLDLTGNSRRSPQIRELRVEYTQHRLLDKLPAVFSADPDRADFLGRYLAIVDGVLYDLDLRSAVRHVLFDPAATPVEAVAWLSSVVGLAQDQRFSESARRTLLTEIVGLFRRRGTTGALTRMLEIYLGHKVQVLEHFRLRGVTGQLLGDTAEPPSSSVLGAGFRVGGTVGPADGPGGEAAPGSGADRYAHRFTVVVPLAMTTEQREVVEHVLDVHRPAHTVVEVCALDAGMRVGRGLHLGISSLVGHTGGFASAVVGDALLGRGSIVGRPGSGAQVGQDRAGRGTVG